jgi:hypothetical protein
MHCIPHEEIMMSGDILTHLATSVLPVDDGESAPPMHCICHSSEVRAIAGRCAKLSMVHERKMLHVMLALTAYWLHTSRALPQ